ncbi:MAG: outer membrane beta-barrel protein [Bacteroidales bacterium]
MIRKLFFILTGLAISGIIVAQNGYLLRDSSKTTGLTIVFGKETDNWRVCQVRSGAEIRNYTPDELSGYGVPGYKTFVSREVEIDGQKFRAFLEQLVLGKTNLYFMRNEEKRLFFIEGGNGELVLLDKEKNVLNGENYRNELLRFFNDTPDFRKYAPHYTFSRSSLSELVKMYNKGEYRPNGLSRGGLVIHAGGETVFTPENIHEGIEKVELTNQMNLFAGLFYETAAIGSNISFRPEILFSHTVYGLNGLAPGTTILDITIKSTSVQIPCVFKYVLPNKHIRPFAGAGALVRLDFNNQRSALYYAENEGWKKSHYLRDPITEQISYGLTGGVGVQYFFNVHRSVDLELRFNGMIGNTCISSTCPVYLVMSTNIF